MSRKASDMSESANTLRDVLSSVRKSVKNARGAIESNQVVDKDVHGTLTRVIATIDIALEAFSSRVPYENDPETDDSKPASNYNPAEQVIGNYQAPAERVVGRHPSHVTRSSDASTFDEVCTKCGATDIACGGWGKLAEPCPAYAEVFASRHNDTSGECESVDMDPAKVAELREKINARSRRGGSYELFEQEFPHHFWHVAKGKVSAGEPLYGALITDHRGIELANGESDKSADDAFSIAVAALRAALSSPMGDRE